MSTNELNTLARDLKELRLMAEQLDTEIKTIRWDVICQGQIYPSSRSCTVRV